MRRAVLSRGQDLSPNGTPKPTTTCLPDIFLVYSYVMDSPDRIELPLLQPYLP
jgi:hypothetical protein